MREKRSEEKKEEERGRENQICLKQQNGNGIFFHLFFIVFSRVLFHKLIHGPTGSEWISFSQVFPCQEEFYGLSKILSFSWVKATVHFYFNLNFPTRGTIFISPFGFALMIIIYSYSFLIFLLLFLSFGLNFRNQYCYVSMFYLLSALHIFFLIYHWSFDFVYYIS